ncbi:MAG: proline dehydrogenase family protein [Candidatus ainarchaeum sp.]|nr:proline dehydrogenase family protein [Candidatus ainarchaeum sp.]
MSKLKQTRPIKRAVNWIFCKTIGRRYTGGSSIFSVIKRAKKLNERGVRVVINNLGEHYRTKEEVERTVRTYLDLLVAMKSSGINGSVSLKPTQFGLCVSHSSDTERNRYTREQMWRVADKAHNLGITIEIDMEDRETLQFTYETYAMFNRWSGGGLLLALQANVELSFTILRQMISLSTPEVPNGVRLVKGIYEPQDPNLMTNDEIMARFSGLTEFVMVSSCPEFRVAIGSHHSDILSRFLVLSRAHPKEFSEVQILSGVMDNIIENVQSEGGNVAVYLPFGENAFAYSFRRMMKNPKFIFRVLTSIFRRKYAKEISGDIVQENTHETELSSTPDEN